MATSLGPSCTNLVQNDLYKATTCPLGPMKTITTMNAGFIVAIVDGFRYCIFLGLLT